MMIRFADQMTGSLSQGNTDPEFHQRHFPNYWHSSEYMQHRLIGPVVVTVHENLKGGPSALTPGTYAVEPRVSYWEAPGPALPDEQILTSSYGVSNPASPNPGWPLPSHVLTTPGTGLSAGPWEKLDMDRYDW